MNYKSSLAGFLLATLILTSVSPILVRAQELPPLPGVPNLNITELPPVPIADSALRNKEVGITIFGFTIPGLSWDKLAIIIAKKFIERMVDSTVNWINSGFDGNPAYASNPKQYFADIADGVAGEFIEGSDLAFLCSPFEANIRVSLTRNYYEAAPFQCTLSEVVANMDAFLNDFSEGGWDGWFSMTQVATNNPYGAYLEAKVELDSRIAEAVGLKREQLSWGDGFLSFETCDEEVLVAAGETGGTTKVCARSSIKTPGKVIESQLEKHLSTGVSQLELADEFDELIGALLAQLLNKSVFSIEGLFKAPRVTGPDTPTTPPPGGAPNCPIPTTPRSLCDSVDPNVVLGILNNGSYPNPNEDLDEAIVEIQGVYPQAEIIPHPLRLDKIDFGGGMIADVVIGAGAPGASWGWIEECECGGPTGTTPPNPVPPETPPIPFPTPPTPPPPRGGPGNQLATVQEVSSGSGRTDWGACQSGNEVACHRFAREVARTLAARDPGWGLLTKSPGENQCTLTEVGPNVSGQGYGCDVIAYISSSQQISIFDIVGGAGAPGASITWNGPLPRRAGNNWAPVP